MQVLKFGGSSVASAATMLLVIDIVKEAAEGDKTIVVASALSGITDQLIEIGQLAGRADNAYQDRLQAVEERHRTLIKELIPEAFQQDISKECDNLFEALRGICKGVSLIKELSPGTADLIMSFGEMLSTKILTAKCVSLGMNCKWIDSRELIKTEVVFSHNVVDTDATYKNIHKALSSLSAKIGILPGFIASDTAGRTTTLGRGGSDYTASLLAVGIEARRLEIWTDVDGMMTADPRIVPQARTIEHISYKEALELSHFGARVVYPPTIQPVVAKGIPILVKNTFSPKTAGTLIEKNPPEGKDKIKGISGSNRIALLSMEGSGMVGIPGYSSRLFDALAQNEINIILITQASSVHTMLVAIEEKDAAKAKKAADQTFAYEISLRKVEPLRVECGFSIISLIGDDMKSQSGASGRMFEAIGRMGINIRAIAQGSSEKNVSAVVATKDIDRAISATHQEFFGTPQHRINLFIAGYGNVGKALVNMINNQAAQILETRGIELNVVGISNSRHSIINTDGVDLNNLPKVMTDPSDGFVDRMCQANLPGSVFVDCTSNQYIAASYPQIMENKIGVVCCNKIANSAEWSSYAALHQCARREKVPFMYETNVGAALPVISLLKQLKQSGDTIERIQASLSGTLNFVWGTYDGNVSFEEVVAEAKELGYTEPDPLTDLRGTDVLRKTLILGREIGLHLQESDITISSFLPEKWPDEAHFQKLIKEAQDHGQHLRYLVDISDKAVTVGLQAVSADNPFYHLRGTSSALLVYSHHYPNGLRIEGAGAGAVQTAEGILNDILQTVYL